MIGCYTQCVQCGNECQLIGDLNSKGEVKRYCCKCWKNLSDKPFNFKCQACSKRDIRGTRI